jgi:hypothetical protein
MQGRLIRSCGTIFVDAPQVLNVRCSKAPLPEDLRAFFVSPHPRSKKGSGTPKGAGLNSATVVAARVQRDALAFRRSTAALANGTAAPKGSASGHASWDSAGAAYLARPNVGRTIKRCCTGVTRPSLSQSSEAPRTPVIVPAG